MTTEQKQVLINILTALNQLYVKEENNLKIVLGCMNEIKKLLGVPTGEE